MLRSVNELPLISYQTNTHTHSLSLLPGVFALVATLVTIWQCMIYEVSLSLTLSLSLFASRLYVFCVAWDSMGLFGATM